MYVQAPRRTSNGSSQSSYNQGRKYFAAWNPSIASALSYIDNDNGTFVAQKGLTTRGLMQDGQVGPHQYVDTDYFANYHEFKTDGRVKFLIQRFTLSEWKTESHPLVYTRGLNTDWTVQDNSSIVDPLGTGTSVGALYNRATIANLTNRVRSELNLKALDTNFDAAEVLTGLKPTVKMVSESTVRLLSAFLAARKGNWQRVAYELGVRRKFKSTTPSDLWLEYQYGWKPLVNDIFDASSEILKAFSQKAPSTDFYTVSRSGSAGLLLPGLPTASNVEVAYQNAALASVKAKLRFTINDELVAYMSSIRIADPGYIAWTALPYSFVVDWILPVGDMLSALHAGSGLKFRGGCVSTRVTAVQQATGGMKRPQDSAYPFTRLSGTAKATLTSVYLHRLALTGFPGFMPYVKFPFGSPERIASAIALIGSAKRYR